MPSRFALVLITCTALVFAHGQSASTSSKPEQSCNCAPPKTEPFTGHVLDAATGKPLAGVEVHYLDDNPPVDGNNRPVRGIISGSVTTEIDGSYKLPTDLPLATFHIRVTAPGYYAAVLNDSQRIAGEHMPTGFLRPSHDIRLKPSPNLVAIGGSELTGATNQMPVDGSLTAATFTPGGDSLVVATRGPGLWLITLTDGHVRPIDLPAELTAPGMSLGSLGWDGEHLVFLAGDATHAFVAGASAPDFHITLLPAPNPGQVSFSIGNPGQGLDRFDIEQTEDCDGPGAGPHCGQNGNIIAHNRDTGQATTVFSAWIGDLSYLHDPMLGGLIVFAEDTKPRDIPRQQINSANMAIPGITLFNLATHERSHVDLPAPWGRHLTMVAERMIPEFGVTAMRLAYTVEGDCDPGSTDKSQPSAPGGNIGFSANKWSVCVVTISVPPTPKPSPAHRVSAAKK